MDLTTTPITANGDYEFPTEPGREYLFAISGNFTAAVLTLYYEHPNSKAWVNTGISIAVSSAELEDLLPRHHAPGTKMRWNVASIPVEDGDVIDLSATPILR